MTAQPLSPFDISPTLKMYMEFIEFSKRNYENFLKSAPLRANGMDGKKAEVESITFLTMPPCKLAKNGRENLQAFRAKPDGALAILGGRWEQYLNLPGQISQCRSLTELGELQSAFLSKFANDYLLEAGKLAGSVAELACHAKPLVPPRR